MTASAGGTPAAAGAPASAAPDASPVGGPAAAAPDASPVGGPAAAAPDACPASAPAGEPGDSASAVELRRLHAELGAYVPELHQVHQLLEASLSLGDNTEVAPMLRQRQRQCEVAALVLSSPLTVVAGREERDLEALRSIKAFIDDSVTTLRDHKALLEAMAGPSGELYKQTSFGTTQRQWQQCGVLVKKNPWQYQNANGTIAPSAAARQSGETQQPQQVQQSPNYQPLQLGQQQHPQQLLQAHAMVLQPGYADQVPAELLPAAPAIPLLPVVQPAPAPLGLDLLQQEQMMQSEGRQGEGPAEGPAPGPASLEVEPWPGFSLRLEDFSLGRSFEFGRSIEMLPLLPSMEGLPSLGQLLEEPLATVSLRMMSIREDEEQPWHGAPSAAAAAAAAAAAMAGAAQQQQHGLGGAHGGVADTLPEVGDSLLMELAGASLPAINTAVAPDSQAGPSGQAPSPQASGDLESSGGDSTLYRRVSFRDLGRAPGGQEQGGTPSSTKSSGTGRSLFTRQGPVRTTGGQ